MRRRADEFVFTVTDLAVFLGKTAETIRRWEKEGLVTLPRSPNGDRMLSPYDVRDIAVESRKLKRITENRLHLIQAAITILVLLEGE